MASLPDAPDEGDDDTASLGRTAQLHGDPPTLAQEIEKAKQQAACLIIIRGKPQGHRFFLTREQMIIGRDPAADICLSDDGISRRHARLARHGGAILLTDLGSANGTYVNEQRVTAT